MQHSDCLKDLLCSQLKYPQNQLNKNPANQTYKQKAAHIISLYYTQKMSSNTIVFDSVKIPREDLYKNLLSDKTGIFVEVGVDRGDFSKVLLRNSLCSKLYCVDPYTSYDDYTDAINTVTGDHLFQNTRDTLQSEFKDRVEMVRAFSKDAISVVPDQLDFVYIDANHSYKYVLQDLKLWYSKLKMNGVLAGDDVVDVDVDDVVRNAENDVYIEWSPGCYGSYGVFKALTNFCTKHEIQCNINGTQFYLTKMKELCNGV